MKYLLSILLSLSVLAVLMMPASVAAGATTPPAARAGATPGDTQLEATIRAKLAKSKIGKDGFKFHVQRGVVTWEGTTDVPQHKGAATRMARTAGAVQVVNNIQVSSTGKSFSESKKAYVK